jgi:ubiquinone/menaquinone biosynthesis C-methylase UbiE
VGVVEKLALDNACVDVVVSNCVMNLTVQKLSAFKEANRVLKPGGWMVISDMVADGELTEYVRWSFEAWTGCMAGLVQKDNYLELIREAGFGDPVILSEQSFQKLGIGANSGDEIKSIVVRAQKPTK